MTSLPVPLSPQMRMVTSLGATRSTVRTTSFISALLNTGEALPLMISIAPRNATFSCFFCLLSKAQRTSAKSFSVSNGFVKKVNAPRRPASIAISIVPMPVSMMTSVSAQRFLISGNRSSPVASRSF